MNYPIDAPFLNHRMRSNITQHAGREQEPLFVIELYLLILSKSNEYNISADLICKLHQCRRRRMHPFPSKGTYCLHLRHIGHEGRTGRLSFSQNTHMWKNPNTCRFTRPWYPTSAFMWLHLSIWLLMCVSTERERERITNQLTPRIFFQVTY